MISVYSDINSIIGEVPQAIANFLEAKQPQQEYIKDSIIRAEQKQDVII